MKRAASMLMMLFGATVLRATDPWTWEKCVERLRDANPELNSARSSLKASEYSESGSYSGFFPSLTGTLGYVYGTTSPFGGGGLSGGAQSIYTASLTISQNLFSGFLDTGKVDQAKANREVSEATLETTKARLSSDLKSAFASLVYAQKSITLTQEIIQRREANLKIVDLQFQSGNENRGSLQLSQAYLEQAKLDNLQAVNSLATAQANLARVLGIESMNEIQVTGTVPVTAPGQKPDLKAIVESSPDYRQSVAQEKAADAAFVIARSGWFPTFAVTGSTANSGNDFFPQNNRWSVGASISFPFFSGGKDYYATKSASESKTAAVLTKENTLRNGVAKLQAAYSTYVESVQKLESDRVFQEAAITRARIARQKYNNGLQTFEDWDLIENDLITRQKTFLQSELNRVTAEATWEQTQGKGVLP